MSRYTTQLRWVIDQTLLSNNLATIPIALPPAERCRMSAPYIFNFDFPIWSEADRARFEQDFLMHFYFEEIGAETYGQWKVYLYDWLNTNMPYWNMKFLALKKNEGVDSLFANTMQEDFLGGGMRGEASQGHEESSNGQDTTGSSHVMQKYYEVPSNNISSIDDHLNNALQNDTIGENHVNGRVYRETGNDMNSTYNDKHLLSRSQNDGSVIAGTMSKLINEAYNVKSRMYKQMAILFMGVL